MNTRGARRFPIRTALGMAGGFLVVLIPVVLLFRAQGWYHGWMMTPALGVTLVYPFSGLAIGGWFGLLSAMRQEVREIAEELRSTFSGQFSAGTPTDVLRPMTIEELERRHERLACQLLRMDGEYAVRPTLSRRLFARHLRPALVEDFLPTIDRAIRVVTSEDLRRWLLDQGIDGISRSADRELRRWRALLVLSAIVLSALPVILVARLR